MVAVSREGFQDSEVAVRVGEVMATGKMVQGSGVEAGVVGVALEVVLMVGTEGKEVDEWAAA